MHRTVLRRIGRTGINEVPFANALQIAATEKAMQVFEFSLNLPIFPSQSRAGTMTPFMQLVRQRRSVRAYTDQPIEREKLMQCLEAAHLAPSACNAQPWRFVVVDNPALKDKVADAATSGVLGMNKFAPQAQIFVALVMESANVTSKLGSLIKKKDFPLIDVGIAAEHFCLQAAELGIGTCMLGWFNEKKVRALLGIPKNKRIPILISIGYPKSSELQEKFRKPMDAICGWNKY